MVKSAERRVAKYGGKIDPDVVRSRIDALKEDMKTYAASAQSDLATFQAQVAAILDEAGISPIFRMPYQALVNRLYGLYRKFTGTVFENEVKLACDLWVSRGANSTVVQKIAALFGVTYTPSS